MAQAYIKTADEIARMRVAGRATAKVLEMIQAYVVPGVSTNRLNDLCHDFIIHELHAIPGSLHYRGFPKSICTSVNHVICHGIPSDKKLKEGDIINIDVTVFKDGFYGDSSCMFAVGEIAAHAERLVRVTQECLYMAINIVKPGCRLGDIGATIQQHAQHNHYSVVREFCGHGIGVQMHEPVPQVLHYGKFNTGMILQSGMTFTIEPMINAGKADLKVLGDGWTAVTRDHRLSAQWEHTLAVTTEGCEVLTLREGEAIVVASEKINQEATVEKSC